MRQAEWSDSIRARRGDSKPGERWTVRETNGETVMLGRDGKVRQFRPSAKGKWDVLVPSTMQVSVTSSREA